MGFDPNPNSSRHDAGKPALQIQVKRYLRIGIQMRTNMLLRFQRSVTSPAPAECRCHGEAPRGGCRRASAGRGPRKPTWPWHREEAERAGGRDEHTDASQAAGRRHSTKTTEPATVVKYRGSSYGAERGVRGKAEEERNQRDRD